MKKRCYGQFKIFNKTFVKGANIEIYEPEKQIYFYRPMTELERKWIAEEHN